MKKKVLKTVVLLLTAALPLTLPAVNSITYTATYDLGNVNIGTDTLGGVTYTTVTYDGLYNGGNPGAPSLPIDYIRFSVPYNATNFSVNAVLRNSSVSNLPHLVYPCQTPRMMEDTLPLVITLPDSSIYYNNVYYPINNAWVVDEGFLAGENHIVTVAVMPISFRRSGMGHLVNNLLRESPTVNLTLSYELSNSPNLYPLVRKDSTLRQEGYQLTRGFVVNPDSIVGNAPSPSYPPSLAPCVWPPDSSLINTDSIYYDINTAQAATFPYLIVTAPELRHSLRRLAALKRQKGFGVALLPTDFIYNHAVSNNGDYVKMPDGTYALSDSSNEGKIRRFLKYVYRYFDTRYLLLAGKNVPYRTQMIEKERINDSIVSYYHIPTDWYFSDLNSNIMLGEDLFDYEPEIFPGRIMARTPEEINNYSDKLFRYELNPGHGDFSYLKKALFVEGREFPNLYDWVINDIENLFQFTTVKIKEVPGGCYPKGSDVINNLNANPVGFLGILNHGSPSRTKVYGSSDENHQAGPQYFIYNQYHENDTCSGLNFLSNKYHPAFFYSPSCYTIQYSYPYATFGDSFIVGKDFGGPIYIGNTIDTYSVPALFMEKDFLKHIKDGYLETGRAVAFSKLKWVNEAETRIAHNLLGDPLLEMWTDTPQHYDNITISRTDNSITVAGVNEDSTIIAYYSNDGRIGRKTISPGSTTLTGVSPNSTVMLYKHNFIPYIAPMKLQNTILNRSQYVIASDVTAGYSIDNSNSRSNGIVHVPSGVEYEIEASGVVTLAAGFSVALGATFAVYPSSF